MNFFDIIVGIALLWGFYKGIVNGLFLELASLIGLIVGIYGAIHFSYIASDYLSNRLDWSGNYINITAFLITFIGIVFLVHFSGKLLTKIADFAMLGVLNKIAGGIFGALKVAIIIGTLLVFVDKKTGSFDFIGKETKQGSILYEPVKDIGALVFSSVFRAEVQELHS